MRWQCGRTSVSGASRIRGLGFGRTLAVIALIGALVRLAHALLVAPVTPVLGDGYWFHELGKLVAEGQSMVSPVGLVRGEVYPTAEHPPLYAFLLAGLTKLGLAGEEAQRAFGSVLGAATIVLVGLSARRLAGEAAGLLAATAAALYPTLIAADGALMSETLYAPLVAAALLAALVLLDRPRPAGFVGLGVLIGLAALTRAEALLLLPLLAVPVAWRAAPVGRLSRSALTVAAVLVVLAPWTIRNWSVFGEPVLISNNSGATLAGSNCDRTYKGDDIGYFRFECIASAPVTNEAESAARLRTQAWSYIRDHGVRVPLVAAVRVMRVWGLFEPWEQRKQAVGRRVLVSAAGLVLYYPLIVLALVGAFRLRSRRGEVWVMLVPFLVVTLTAALMYGGLRFRQTAEPAIAVLAGVGIAAVAAGAVGRGGIRPLPRQRDS